jgi:hypothetical protein
MPVVAEAASREKWNCYVNKIRISAEILNVE